MLLVTHFTAERTFTCVNAHVTFQAKGLCKLLVTDFTTERT